MLGSEGTRRGFVLLATVASTGGCVTPFTARAHAVVADTAASDQQLLLAARADQAAFEEWRREHLPMRFGATRTKPRCMEPLGRFCLEEGTGYGAWIDMRNNPRIAEERVKLIDALHEVARRIPDNDWVIGQLVRYTVEGGRIGEAAASALNCAATPWWCAALLGYVIHEGGRGVAADPFFARALGLMTPRERERWMDPRPLLDPDDAVYLGRMDEASRTEFVQHFWHLADPFLTRPGNEILAEHLARRVELQFRWASGPTEGLEWGPDLDEILLRYGPPSRRIAALGAEFDLLGAHYHIGPARGIPDLMSHYAMPALDLLPATEFLITGRGSWDAIEDMPRAGYDVAVGDSAAVWLPGLAHQVAVFDRADEAVVVAAFDLPSHGFLGEQGAEGALALLPADDSIPTEPETTPARVEEGVGAVLRRTARRPVTMSLEAFIPDRHIAGRTRRRLEITPHDSGGIALSDMLFLHARSPLPNSLEDAMATVRGSNRVSSGEEIAIFWEMYGVEPSVDSTVTMSLLVGPEESSGIRRLGEIVGILGQQYLARITWQEEITGEPVMARAVTLSVPELRDGTHTLELAMEVAGERVARWTELVVASGPIEPLPPRAMTRRPQLVRLLCGSVSEFGLMVGNLQNLAASAPYQDLSAQFFEDYTLEPPPCPTHLPDIMYETGHGY